MEHPAEQLTRLASDFYQHLHSLVCKVLYFLVPLYNSCINLRTALIFLHITLTSGHLGSTLWRAVRNLFGFIWHGPSNIVSALRAGWMTVRTGRRISRPPPRPPLPSQNEQKHSLFGQLPGEMRNAIYELCLQPVLKAGRLSPYPCPNRYACPHHDNVWRVAGLNLLLTCRVIYHEAHHYAPSKLYYSLSDFAGCILQLLRMQPAQLPWLFLTAPLPPDTRPPAQQALPSRDIHIPYGWRLDFARIFLSPYLCITPDFYVYWHPVSPWQPPAHHCGRMMQISGRRIGFDELPENEAGSLQDVLPRRGYRDHTKIELRVEGRWLWVRRVWIGWIEDFTGLRTSNGTVWDINDVADEPFPRSW